MNGNEWAGIFVLVIGGVILGLAVLGGIAIVIDVFRELTRAVAALGLIG